MTVVGSPVQVVTTVTKPTTGARKVREMREVGIFGFEGKWI
jgi:hypothetical protein